MNAVPGLVEASAKMLTFASTSPPAYGPGALLPRLSLNSFVFAVPACQAAKAVLSLAAFAPISASARL